MGVEAEHVTFAPAPSDTQKERRDEKRMCERREERESKEQ